MAIKTLLTRFLSPNLRTTAFFFVGNFAISVGNYGFHLLLLRLLSLDAYGEFLSYISFLYLITIPAETVGTLVTTMAADYFGKQQFSRLKKFFYSMLRWLVVPSVVLGTIIIFSAQPLAHLLKANPLAFVVLGSSLVLTLMGALIRSHLMAVQQFGFHVVIGLVEIILKLVLAYFLIAAGWSATGGVIALLIASVIGLGIIFWKLREYLWPPDWQPTAVGISVRDLLTYSLILAAGTVSLFSVDVLMVRYFFDTFSSGVYAALSILARMIYFGLAPLSILALPVIAHRHAAGKDTRMVFLKLLAVTIALGLVGVGIFNIDPVRVMQLLSGPQYLSGAAWLPWFSLTMLLLAINRLGLIYFMAVGKSKAMLWLLVMLILQPLLLGLVHRQLGDIIWINLGVQILLMMGLGVYYYASRVKENRYAKKAVA